VRKQYYFRPSEGGFDAWDVNHLIELSTDFRVNEVSLTSIRELDTVYWFGADGSPATVRILVRHMQFVNDVDPSYPVILGSEGEVMDGMYRVARSLLEGRTTIAKPDFRNVRPEDLSYD
jgi:hypothetical protein